MRPQDFGRVLRELSDEEKQNSGVDTDIQSSDIDEREINEQSDHNSDSVINGDLPQPLPSTSDDVR